MLLITSFSYAGELSDEKAISLIKKQIIKEQKIVYSFDRAKLFIYGVRDILFDNVEIIKRGSYKKAKNYYPFRLRVKGNSLIKSGFLRETATEERKLFDLFIESRLSINDFDEWEVEIVKVSQPPTSLLKKERLLESKEKQKSDPLNNYCNNEAGWYKFKASSNLTIRNRPSVKGKKIGLLKKGDIINGECSVYEVLKNGVSGYWVSINKTGIGDRFVFGHYLTPVDTKHTPIPARFLGEWDIKPEKMNNLDRHCSKDMSDSKVTIKPYSIAYWESGGSVKDLEVIDSDSVNFILLMAGEGESWTSKFKLTLENSSLIIKRDDFTNTYVQCK